MENTLPPQATDPNGFEQQARQTVNAPLITSATVVNVNTDRPYASKQLSTTGISENELVAAYRLFDPALKKSLSAKLKAAGYRVPVTDQYNLAVRQAWIQANTDLSDFVRSTVASDPGFFNEQPFTVDEFLTLSSAGGAGGPKTYTTIYSEEKASSLVDTIFKDLTGMPASQADKDKYSKMLRSEQASNPTTYDAGSGTTVVGMDAAESQKMLIDEISETDEAKRMRAMNGYRVLLSELGVSV